MSRLVVFVSVLEHVYLNSDLRLSERVSGHLLIYACSLNCIVISGASLGNLFHIVTDEREKTTLYIMITCTSFQREIYAVIDNRI